MRLHAQHQDRAQDAPADHAHGRVVGATHVPNMQKRSAPRLWRRLWVLARCSLHRQSVVGFGRERVGAHRFATVFVLVRTVDGWRVRATRRVQRCDAKVVFSIARPFELLGRVLALIGLAEQAAVRIVAAGHFHAKVQVAVEIVFGPRDQLANEIVCACTARL
jgi:hypothetical protein